METKFVVESGLADPNNGLYEYVKITGVDKLFFPHIDSCLAIVYYLNDSSVVGGHIVMEYNNPENPFVPDFQGLIGTMHGKLTNLAPNAQITSRLYVGPGDWETAVNNHKANANSSLYIKSGRVRNGVNMLVVPNASMVTIRQCTMIGSNDPISKHLDGFEQCNLVYSGPFPPIGNKNTIAPYAKDKDFRNIV